MQYDYRCESPVCSKVTEFSHSVNGFKEFRPPCPHCGSPCTYEFNPTVIQFAIKDGPSGTSPSKAIRVKKHMQEKHEKIGRRQRDRYGHLRRDAVPNWVGSNGKPVLAESWREAQSMAMKDKEFQEARQTDSIAVASTFNDKIATETKGDAKIVSK